MAETISFRQQGTALQSRMDVQVDD